MLTTHSGDSWFGVSNICVDGYAHRFTRLKREVIKKDFITGDRVVVLVELSLRR